MPTALRDVKLMKPIKNCLLLVICSALFACAKPQPNNTNSICAIFKQYPTWYWAAEDVQTRWKVPISVQMAIMHQESRFHAKAKPPRTKLLWVIPWKRPSTAYGYTQALDMTWEGYKKSSGNSLASRNNFNDAVDFIGWYAYQAHRKSGISRSNAYQLYLAYHEGVGGYQRKTYLRKPWLIKVAQKVRRRANVFQGELSRCQSQLIKKPWYRLW